MNTEDNKKEDSKKDKKNILEWIIFSISLLLVVTSIGYLAYKTVTHHASPPDIRLTFEPSQSDNSLYRYHIIVQNDGGATAKEVVIEVLLKEKNRIIEKSEVQLPFVPQGSKVESWITFIHDPAAADTVLGKVVSFKKP